MAGEMSQRLRTLVVLTEDLGLELGSQASMCLSWLLEFLRNLAKEKNMPKMFKSRLKN